MSDCPCPLERKVLIQTMNEIVGILSEDARKKKECEACCVQPKRCGGDTGLSRVTSGCRETAVVPYQAGAGAPVKACKSSELRAGVFYSECRCLKRDGLQRACRRSACSDRCGYVRPARREPVPLGTPEQGYSLRPVCCPGEKEAERLQFLHAKADLQKRKPPLPPLEPLPMPPAPPYNWTGTFEHKCKPDERCPRRRAPRAYPCGGAKCKHWEVPKPCTLPICRADCFEHAPGWPTFCR
ncbi:uncharacterized protein LOC113217309 [Frankliniella occidentalis]|uniref:Uncharacterized protein LOC113217309 n=1 Tax=Frankliniella occidentalis TaxID=133901 RepID=A0A6J1TI31_FRAOC|nr:uncharacterized protein LOC113217309 [Frankliniella occidentalis]